MFFIQYFNERVKRFNIYDIKMIQGAAICFALVLAQLIPDLLKVPIYWFIILAILFAIRPGYILFFKK